MVKEGGGGWLWTGLGSVFEDKLIVFCFFLMGFFVIDGEKFG